MPLEPHPPPPIPNILLHHGETIVVVGGGGGGREGRGYKPMHFLLELFQICKIGVVCTNTLSSAYFTPQVTNPETSLSVLLVLLSIIDLAMCGFQIPQLQGLKVAAYVFP